MDRPAKPTVKTRCLSLVGAISSTGLVQQNVSPQWKTRKLFMFKNLAFILLITALSACAFNSGERSGNLKLENASQESLASQFKPDIATRDDVVSQLGPPDKKITAGSLEVWTYSYASNAYVMVAFAAVPTGAKKVANFYFDDKTGVLKKVELDMHRG